MTIPLSAERGNYFWQSVDVTGNGNGALMDGHCNATEDPNGGSKLVDMVVPEFLQERTNEP